jgi:hypothetical protein
MPIPLTNLHKGRIVEQISQNLVGLQNDIRRNAQAHKSMALAQSPDLATLQSFISDCVAEYLKRCKWIIDLRADPSRKARLLDALTKYGWTEADIVDVLTPMRAAVITLRDAPRTTYAQIISACDAVIVAVEPPDSLWPE